MRRLRFLPVAAAVTALAGCGSSDGGGATTGGSAATTTDAGKKVAYISPVAAQPGQQQLELGLKSGAKELGWEGQVIDANLSADKQVSAVDTAITQKLDAISSWSLDAQALAGAYERALSAGIPVISLNTDDEVVTGNVWNEQLLCVPGGAEERSAQFIADRIPGARTIVMTGPPAPSIVSMTKCFTDAAKKAGLEIVNTTANTNDTADAAQRLMDDLLTKYPDVEAVWSYNDQSALGNAASLGARGKKIATADQDGIILLGHNGDVDAIAAVKDGRMTGTWDPNYYATGLAIVSQMRKALKEDKTLPKVVVKADFWTSETVGDYDDAEKRGYTLDSFPVVDGSAN